MAAKAIEVRGVNELDRALRELERKVASQFAKDALKTGAKIIQAEQVREAPDRTGKLQRGIKIRAGRRRKGEVSVLITTPSAKSKSGAFYTDWVEGGHFTGKRLAKGAEGKGAGAKRRYHELSLAAGRKFIPGQHFMQRGFAAKAQQATDLAVAFLWAKIQAEAKT
jgi:HK97 gp10 family phage protein